jgi:hypothetical protein
MRTEVILLLYNRPGHSLKVLDSLIQAGVPHVRAFLDHSEDPGVQGAQEELLSRFAERKQISVTLHRHTRRLGLARSVRFALDSVLSEADAAIVLEDDCVVRPGGIDFFREGLSALRYERRIRSLCGYLFPCSFIRSASEPLLLRRFSTWGWATWRDRWCDYEPDLGRVLRRLDERGLVPADIAGDIAALCESKEYLENKADIWSVNWILEHYATGTFCVYPCDSMIDNIGFDGTGNNCEPTHEFRTAAAEEPEKAWNFKQLFHCVENEDLLKRFMSDHGLKTYPRS